MPFVERPQRIPMLGGRVELPRGFADLVNLSRTGALVRTGFAIRVGADWPMTIKLAGNNVVVTGRVVRCESVDVALPAGAALRHQFGVAFTFVDPTPEAEATLLDVCGDGVETGEP